MIAVPTRTLERESLTAAPFIGKNPPNATGRAGPPTPPPQPAPHDAHRRLEQVHPVHAEIADQDPIFYAHLAAWYRDNGDVRDHLEMFVITLSTYPSEEIRAAGD